MYEYYALVYSGGPLNDYIGVARYKEGLFEKYDIKKDIWQQDNELFGIYCGKYEADKVTQEQAINIIENLRCSYINEDSKYYLPTDDTLDIGTKPLKHTNAEAQKIHDEIMKDKKSFCRVLRKKFNQY